MAEYSHRVSPSWHRFWKRAATAALLFWTLVAIWNIVVDPYGVFGVYEAKGFNHVKTSNARLQLAIELLNDPPETLLLGSSRVGFFRDEIARLGTKPSLYSLPDLRASEVGPLAAFFAENADLKSFYWGIDFFAFNAFARNDTPAYGRLDDLFWADFVLRNVLSWETAREALLVVERSGRPEEAGGGGFLPNDAMTKRFRATLRTYLGPRFYWGYRFDDGQIASIESSLEQLKRDGTSITLFIGPLHASLALTLQATGNWDNFERFKREMTAMASRLDLPLWDFSSFNSISMEPIGLQMRWYH